MINILIYIVPSFDRFEYPDKIVDTFIRLCFTDTVFRSQKVHSNFGSLKPVVYCPCYVVHTISANIMMCMMINISDVESVRSNDQNF